MKLKHIFLFLAAITTLLVSIALNWMFEVNPLITIGYSFVYFSGCYALCITERYNL
jgi:hypothetical protein